MRHSVFKNILQQNIIITISRRGGKIMKRAIKSTLSKGITAVLNRTLTSSANASSSYVYNQPVEPASLKKFKKTK